MLLILDTANTEEIKRLNDIFPIAGVTTNPTIISREKREFLPLLREIREIIGEDKMLHVQVLADTAEKIIEEADVLLNEIGRETYIKIPVTNEGIKAIKVLKSKGVKTLATAIFTPLQALVAARAGATFVAPYVNRIDNISSNGVKVVSEILKMYKLYNVETKVLAASFKNIQQIHEIALEGVDAITASPDLIERLIYHPMTDWSVEHFVKDWESVYGEGTKIMDLK